MVCSVFPISNSFCNMSSLGCLPLHRDVHSFHLNLWEMCVCAHVRVLRKRCNYFPERCLKNILPQLWERQLETSLQ